MPSFADSWQHTELLKIAKEHRDAIDPGRITDEAVIGVENANRLKVATVFSAITVEAALNDYILIHCNFLDSPYLEGVFGDITTDYLRGSVQKKINLIRDHWPNEIPPELIKDVRKMFEIRNRIAHQSSEFIPSFNSDSGGAMMTNRPLTGEQMLHMLRHHDIALEFLGRFWLHGNRELTSRRRSAGP